jgi:HlyD family secretion protein
MDILLEIWTLLDRRQRRQLALLQIIAMLMGISTLGGIAAFMPFLMVLADPQLISSSTALTSLHEYLGFSNAHGVTVALGLGFIAVVLLTNAINLLGSLAMARFAQRVGDRFHAALLNDYLHRDYLFHAHSNSSTLFNNVVNETNRVTKGLMESGLLLITSAVTTVFIVASMVLVNALVALAAVVWLGGTYLLIYRLARRKLLQNGVVESRCAAERAKVVNESLGAIKEILVCANQAFFCEDFAQSSRLLSRSALSSQAIAQSPKYVLECLIVAGLVFAALFLSSNRGIGSWLAQLTFLGFAAYRLLPTLQQAFTAIARIRSSRAAFENIASDLRRALQGQGNTSPGSPDARWQGRPREEIRLQNVSFRYAASGPFAIRDTELRIPAGAMVGLIGSNGSGKTTLVDIILGLLIPETGRLEVDGETIDNANRAAWQSRLAYVPQNPFLLDATIAQNIALGIPRRLVDQDRVREAARLAQLDHFVGRLPHGLEERVGERGFRLSGGQRQRIAMARALYRDASVLIMDEATSALDKPTEQDILDTLRSLRGNRTIILVAHRLSVLRRCDVVFELDGGMLIRSGSCEELMRHSPLLRRMLGQALEPRALVP